jgi:hypothetical protein
LLFSIKKLSLVLSLFLLFGLGLAVRFYRIDQPPFDFHPTRQFFSALKARGMYYASLPDAPAWQRSLAIRQWESDIVLEPPIMEHTAAFLYRFVGEQLWLPRAFSVLFWILGGLFLFLLARQLTSTSGGIATLALYLLLPYAVFASRAFQPEPLMVLLIILFWWLIERWSRQPGWWLTVFAGLAGGFAILVKFPAFFFVTGGALGAIFANTSLRKVMRLPQTWLMLLLGSLPAGLYLINGVLHSTLGGEFSHRIQPMLLLEPFFYIRWFNKATNVVDVIWLALALLATFVFATPPTRRLLAGLWGGYLGLGLMLTYHISSHDYYSLPLLPITALALAPLADDFYRHLVTRLSNSRVLRWSGAACFLLAVVGAFWNTRTAISQENYLPQTAFYARVGAALNHQPGVIAVTEDYGYPLAYYGWQNNDPWPAGADSVNFENRFRNLAAKKDYFLITDFTEFNRQAWLKDYLVQHYAIFLQGDGYLVFDLHHPPK